MRTSQCTLKSAMKSSPPPTLLLILGFFVPLVFFQYVSVQDGKRCDARALAALRAAVAAQGECTAYSRSCAPMSAASVPRLHVCLSFPALQAAKHVRPRAVAALGAAVAAAARRRVARAPRGVLSHSAARARRRAHRRRRRLPEPGFSGQQTVGPPGHLQPAARQNLRLCGVHRRRKGAACASSSDVAYNALFLPCMTCR